MTLPTAAATIAPPGPKGPRVKSLVQAAWNPLGFVTSMTVRYGEFVTLREGKTTWPHRRTRRSGCCRRTT